MTWKPLLVLAAAVTVGVGTVPGVAQAAPPPAVEQVRTTASVFLADAAGTLTTVESMALGAGSWTVTSDVTAINFHAGDYVRCQLQANGVLFDGGATVYLANRVSGLVDVGTVKLTAAGTVAVLCDHDHAAGSAGQFYVDPGATLTAVKGAPISAPGFPSAAHPVVVESRTTAATSLVDTSYLPVTSVSLPVGTWAITADDSAVNFSSFDWAACSIAMGGGGTVTANFVEGGTGGVDAIVTGLDLEATATVTASTTATLLCASDFTNSVYIDAGATVTATKVAASAVKSVGIPQIALSNTPGAAKVVSTTRVPAGAWRVRSEVQIGNRFPNNSYGSGQDFVRCGLRANGVAIDGGATELITSNSNIQGVVNAGSFTSSSPWTLTLACSHDAQNTTGGRWTVTTGMLQAVNKGPIN